MILSHEFYLKFQGWRLGSFFKIRQFRWTIVYTEVWKCNRKSRGWGWRVALPYKSDGGARQKISRTPLKGYQNLVLRTCLLQIIF